MSNAIEVRIADMPGPAWSSRPVSVHGDTAAIHLDGADDLRTIQAAARILRGLGARAARLAGPGQPCQIFGDGENSRDFCYVDNVVQANLLAARVADPGVTNDVYNVGCNGRTTLNELFAHLRDSLAGTRPALRAIGPVHTDPRPGDVLHSQANIDKIVARLGYEPTHDIASGLKETAAWFAARAGQGVG
jgi:nucleoside-diphosphate-sugar epimerase